MAPAPLGGLDDSEFAGEARSYWSRAFGRFLQHRLAVASLILLVLIFAAGLLASRLAPYGYQEVNLHALNSGPSWSHRSGPTNSDATTSAARCTESARRCRSRCWWASSPV